MAKSKNDLDISVLIATYNRADILRKTLENMTCLDRDGLSVEFVVVDNNNSDHTKEVIESFTDRLPIRYLFEPRLGKNCALNKALNEVPLGKLVVFTDDDVEPKKDWLKSIIAITNRWPDYSVFGGRIHNIWPFKDIPSWAQKLGNLEWTEAALSIYRHFLLDHGESEKPFPLRRFPAGANFWVQRQILTGNCRFDEFFGPRPKNRIMGSEASFIKKLSEEGYKILYSPHAVVGHYIQPEMLKVSSIRKRIYRAGGTSPHLWGLRPRILYEKHRFLWWLWRVLALTKNLFAYIIAKLSFYRDKRVIRSLKALSGIAYNIESLKIAYKNSSLKR